jgi:hypothetical protein
MCQRWWCGPATSGQAAKQDEYCGKIQGKATGATGTEIADIAPDKNTGQIQRNCCAQRRSRRETGLAGWIVMPHRMHPQFLRRHLMDGEPVLVMLVEDNADHAELVMRTLAEHRVANRIRHLSDGQAALDYLFNRDVTRAYDHHVNSYLVKPVSYEEFSELMEDLGFYWLGRNTRPQL